MSLPCSSKGRGWVERVEWHHATFIDNIQWLWLQPSAINKALNTFYKHSCTQHGIKYALIALAYPVGSETWVTCRALIWETPCPETPNANQVCLQRPDEVLVSVDSWPGLLLACRLLMTWCSSNIKTSWKQCRGRNTSQSKGIFFTPPRAFLLDFSECKTGHCRGGRIGVGRCAHSKPAVGPPWRQDHLGWQFLGTLCWRAHVFEHWGAGWWITIYIWFSQGWILNDLKCSNFGYHEFSR